MDNGLVIFLAIVIAVVIWYIVCWYNLNKKIRVVRFFRPTCKYCVESQKEWNAFKAHAAASDLNAEIIDVNLDNDDSVTRKWRNKYKVTGVPKVIKVSLWGSEEYTGPRTSSAYMNFAMGNKM